jgi:hypothetical protein
VLAELVVVIRPSLFGTLELGSAFLHQVVPHVFRFVHADRKVAHFFIYAIGEFLRGLFHGFVLIDLLRSPVSLLRRDVGCRRNGDVWIHKE